MAGVGSRRVPGEPAGRAPGRQPARQQGPRKSLVDPELIRKQQEHAAPGWNEVRSAGSSSYDKVYGRRPGQAPKQLGQVVLSDDGTVREYITTGSTGSMEKGEIEAMEKASGVRRLPSMGTVAGKDTGNEFI